jgi:hypothetical protein
VTLYRINLTTYASTVIEFETDETDPEKIAGAFWESNPDTPSLCHQCAGGRHGQNLDLGDVWDIDVFDGELQITQVEGL